MKFTASYPLTSLKDWILYFSGEYQTFENCYRRDL